MYFKIQTPYAQLGIVWSVCVQKRGFFLIYVLFVLQTVFLWWLLLTYKDVSTHWGCIGVYNISAKILWLRYLTGYPELTRLPKIHPITHISGALPIQKRLWYYKINHFKIFGLDVIDWWRLLMSLVMNFCG